MENLFLLGDLELQGSSLGILLKKLIREKVTTSHTKGSNIYLHKSEIYIVCEGFVKLHTIQTDGNEITLGLIGESMPFGLELTKVSPYFATAFTDVALFSLSIVEIKQSYVLTANFFPLLIYRLKMSEAWLSLANIPKVPERLFQLLILLAKEFGEIEDKSIYIPLRITHQQIAQMIGSTRVSVTRTLNKFRKEGWLQINQRQLSFDHQYLKPFLEN